jgi:hypothetical protein
MQTGYYRATETIRNAHPYHPNYPILPDDILWYDDAGWVKTSGMSLSGFEFTDSQVSTFKFMGMRRA